MRWANRISAFLRGRREAVPSDGLAISRAMSRASSWIERGTLLAGVFGQHLGMSTVRDASRSGRGRRAAVVEAGPPL